MSVPTRTSRGERDGATEPHSSRRPRTDDRRGIRRGGGRCVGRVEGEPGGEVRTGSQPDALRTKPAPEARRCEGGRKGAAVRRGRRREEPPPGGVPLRG